MALALVREVRKVSGLLRAASPALQITANYARHRKRFIRSNEPTEHPTYRVGGLYEPDYLEKLQPISEQYETLDIDIEGYDFPVLEKFHAYVFKQIRGVGLDYLNSYGHPNKEITVEIVKPKSEAVQEVYKLRKFKRTIQISDVPVYKIGLLIDILYATAPPGVSFTIVPHDEEREEDRYVPDIYMAETKRELSTLLGPK